MMGEAEERQKQEQKYIKMTTTPVEKLICSLAGPTIVSMLVTSFYNMADTFFVGKIGTSATGAVGIVFSVMAIIQAFDSFSDMVPETMCPESWAKRTLRKPLGWRRPDLSQPFWRDW